jgi:hypothetical protein
MNGSAFESCYVVLHMGLGPSKTVEQQASSPLIVRQGSAPFELSDDIWIERLDEDLSKNIQIACEPAGFRVDNVRHDRHLYAFVRKVPGNEKYRYEGMSALKGLIALSRVINPTTIGDRYSANVHRFPAPDSAVFPIQYSGVSPDIIATAQGYRDWLSIADGEILRKLMPLVISGKQMHPRIHRAYWNHEHALRSYYLDIRWTLVVSAFEALMNTQEKFVRRQFCERVGQLATEFGVCLSAKELNDAYTLRCGLVHAQAFLVELAHVLPSDKHVPLYEKLEHLLRATVLRCLLDENFGNSFKDKAAVEARWASPKRPHLSLPTKRKKK